MGKDHQGGYPPLQGICTLYSAYVQKYKTILEYKNSLP